MSKIYCPFKYKHINYCQYYLCDYPMREEIPPFDMTIVDLKDAIRIHQEEVYKDKFGWVAVEND